MIAERFGPGFRHHGGAVAQGSDLWHLLFPLALLAALVALGVVLVMALRRTSHVQASGAPAVVAGDPALREARMRYARGEMTREQYLEINSDLGGPSEPPPQG